MMLVRIPRVAFPRVASISTRTRVCVVCISPHRFVERDEVAATRASNCPDPNAHHHRVVIASTRSMRAFVHSSSRVNNVDARRPRFRDRSTNGCFLFLCIFFPSTSRRTHRDGLARRDDASMDDESNRRDRATTDRAIDADADHRRRDDGMNETRDRHTRARE